MRKRMVSAWPRQALGNLAVFLNGDPYRPTDWGDSGLPIVRIENLNDPSASFHYFHGDTSHRVVIDDGELLLAWSASLGVHWWNRGRALLNQHIFKVTPSTDLVERGFLYYVLQWAMSSLVILTHGGTMHHIQKPALESFVVPCPPIEEQRRIAAKLDVSMDNIRQAEKALAEQRDAARALRSAVLRTALDPATHPSWHFSKLGNVCDVVNGVGFPEYLQGKSDLPYPFVKVSDMNADGAEVTLSAARNTVDDAILATLGGHVYPAGTVIFPKVGGALLTNKKRILGQPSCFDNNVMGLVPQNIDGRFLYMWFQRVDLRTLSNTQALPSVRQSVIAALEIPLPSHAEQRRIAHDLDNSMTQIDAIAISLNDQISMLDALRTSLLDAAFSGQV